MKSLEHAVNYQVNARLRALMRQSRTTQQKIADTLRLHPSTVSHKMNGLRRWSIAELYVVADLIGCRMSDIMPSVDEWRSLRQNGVRRTDAPVRDDDRD